MEDYEHSARRRAMKRQDARDERKRKTAEEGKSSTETVMHRDRAGEFLPTTKVGTPENHKINEPRNKGGEYMSDEKERREDRKEDKRKEEKRERRDEDERRDEKRERKDKDERRERHDKDEREEREKKPKRRGDAFDDMERGFGGNRKRSYRGRE